MLDTPEVNGVRLEDVIEAGERLPGMAALWMVSTVDERCDMVKDILEPGGLHYDVETKEIAAITPRPTFLPVLRLLEEVSEYEEATGMLVTSRWRRRNRRDTGALSPVLTLYLAPDGELYILLQELLAQDQIQANDLPLPIIITPRRPGPKKPRRSIPSIEWPAVVRRIIDNQEPLRKVAEDYGVSHETVRRTVRTACKR